FRRMEDLEMKVKTYERLLQDIKPLLDGPQQQAIQQVMADVGSAAESRKSNILKPQPPSISNESQVHRTTGFSPMPTFASPTIDEDVVMETDSPQRNVEHLVMDINTNSVNKPSGYMGRVSDESWLSKIIDDLARKPALQTPSYEPLLRNDDIREQTLDGT